jgi:hypothetical protein
MTILLRLTVLLVLRRSAGAQPGTAAKQLGSKNGAEVISACRLLTGTSKVGLLTMVDVVSHSQLLLTPDGAL